MRASPSNSKLTIPGSWPAEGEISSPEKKRSFLEEMPAELKLSVAQELDDADILSLRATCKSFNNISTWSIAFQDRLCKPHATRTPEESFMRNRRLAVRLQHDGGPLPAVVPTLLFHTKSTDRVDSFGVNFPEYILRKPSLTFDGRSLVVSTTRSVQWARTFLLDADGSQTDLLQEKTSGAVLSTNREWLLAKRLSGKVTLYREKPLANDWKKLISSFLPFGSPSATHAFQFEVPHTSGPSTMFFSRKRPEEFAFAVQKTGRVDVLRLGQIKDSHTFNLPASDYLSIAPAHDMAGFWSLRPNGNLQEVCFSSTENQTERQHQLDVDGVIVHATFGAESRRLGIQTDAGAIQVYDLTSDGPQLSFCVDTAPLARLHSVDDVGSRLLYSVAEDVSENPNESVIRSVLHHVDFAGAIKRTSFEPIYGCFKDAVFFEGEPLFAIESYENNASECTMLLGTVQARCSVLRPSGFADKVIPLRGDGSIVAFLLNAQEIQLADILAPKSSSFARYVWRNSFFRPRDPGPI